MDFKMELLAVFCGCGYVESLNISSFSIGTISYRHRFGIAYDHYFECPKCKKITTIRAKTKLELDQEDE